jgi:hypothetical protein
MSNHRPHSRPDGNTIVIFDNANTKNRVKIEIART